MAVTVRISRYSYPETVERLCAAITGAGATVFASIDQAAAAAGAGLTLRPTALIVFGNPKAGTILMQAAPLCGLDLPLKFLVWEESGAVQVAYVPAADLARRYDGLAASSTVIANIDAQLNRLASVIADS
jgi:uncharacterized protein (DUF302 family)